MTTSMIVRVLSLIAVGVSVTTAFQTPTSHRITPRPLNVHLDSKNTCLFARKTLTKERTFDPLDLATDYSEESPYEYSKYDLASLVQPRQDDTASSTKDTIHISEEQRRKYTQAGIVGTTALTAWNAAADQALAAATTTTSTDPTSIFTMGNMNPSNFQPVCPASDGFYRFLQTSTVGVIGKENFVEYGPLIAGGLLRVRLELCVVESFFNEAVGPFIAENGLNWVLPLHETVETFVAGSIFAFATTFILIGSTKILSVIATYMDFLFGFPSRLFGNFFFDRASGKKVTLDIGFGPFKTRLIGPPDEFAAGDVTFGTASWPERVVLVLSAIVKYFGLTLGFVQKSLDALDVFVGRYLVLWASAYILLKFVHFKIFPDFP